MKNNPLSEKETAVFELLNGLIENADDKKLAFTVMLLSYVTRFSVCPMGADILQYRI